MSVTFNLCDDNFHFCRSAVANMLTATALWSLKFRWMFLQLDSCSVFTFELLVFSSKVGDYSDVKPLVPYQDSLDPLFSFLLW